MMFKLRSQLLQVQAVHIIHKGNKVRIAHRNCRTVIENLFFGYIIMIIIQNNCLVNENIMIAVHRNFGSTENRLAHIYLRTYNLTVFDNHFNFLYTGKCFQRNSSFIGQTFVMHKFSYAAHAVTAHLAFAAVSVEHTHFEISNVRFANADKTVTANTKASMTYIFGNSARVRQHLLGAVYIDIIITSTMHFCKFYFHGPSSFESSLLIITKIY